MTNAVGDTATAFAMWYADAYGRFAPEASRPGRLPVDVIRVAQDTHYTVDEMGDSFALVLCNPKTAAHARMDFGDGWVDGRLDRPALSFQPARSSPVCDVSGAHEVVIVAMPEKLPEQLLGEHAPPLGSLDILTRTLLFEDLELQRCVAALWHTVEHGGSAQALKVDALTQLTLARLFQVSGEMSMGGNSALPDATLSRVVSLIHARLRDGIGIKELAAEAELSPWHFSRSFKAAIGLLPHVFLAKKRLERAQELLSETEMPIAVVADLCGFSSQQHMTTAFRRDLGTTPTRYRKAIRY